MYDEDEFDEDDQLPIGELPAHRGIPKDPNPYCWFPTPFRYQTANEWLAEAAKQPPARKLFGSLWHEGELAVLFGRTGVGKSILALQIAESIASGVPIGKHQLTAPAQQVLYFDLESTAAQFRSRYIYKNKAAKFHPNLTRASVDAELLEDKPDDYRTIWDYIGASVVDAMGAREAKIVIIDSIAHLAESGGTGFRARKTMNRLRQLRDLYGLSILAVAPQNGRARKPAPLGLADLESHRHVVPFADTIFAISPSTFGEDIRYIKHLKSRTGTAGAPPASTQPPLPSPDDVHVYRLDRADSPAALNTDQPAASDGSDSPPWLSTPPLELPEPDDDPSNLTRNSAIQVARGRITALADAHARQHAPSTGPFIGLRHLGTSPEPDHHRDHSADIKHLQFTHQLRLLARSGLPASLINLILKNTDLAKKKEISVNDQYLDVEYKRYLDG